jgi:lipopolysaccharide export system protein LptA
MRKTFGRSRVSKFSIMTSNLGMFVLAAAALVSMRTSVRADLLTTCGINLGYADKTSFADYAIFTIGGSFVDTDTTAITTGDITGNTDIYGDIGISGSYNNAGTGSQTFYSAKGNDLKLSGNVNVAGTVFMDSGTGTSGSYSEGKFTKSGNVVVTGNSGNANLTHHSDLSQGVYDAVRAAGDAANPLLHPTTAGSPTTINTNQSMTLTATSTSTVLRLQDFTLTGGTFTLQGTAAQGFIFNVSRTFSLSGNAKIALSGGITWDNILWNVTGTGTDVQLSSQSDLQGYLLASQRSVNMSGGSTVYGEVIAGGKGVLLSGGSRVTKPPRVSHGP